MSNFNLVFILFLLNTAYKQIGASELNCTVTKTEMICDKQLSKYCKCNHELITCDFTNFAQPEGKPCLELQRGWTQERKQVKRMCFCGGSHNVEYLFSSDLTKDLPILQRVDFYNIPGIIRLSKTFGSNFAGDLYMSGVRVNTIHAYEFQKESKMDIQDVSDIECCSKIAPYSNVTHPLLSIENSSLGLIKKFGFKDDNQDQWRTVFFNHVQFKGIQKEGMVFDQPGLNISIIGCRFQSLSDYAIMIYNASNVFLAKNSLHLTILNDTKVQPSPLLFNSSIPESSILLIENYFNNEIQFFLQAQRVYIWFNRFDMWYNRTFSHLLLRSGETPSSFSVAWNAVNITKYIDFSALPKPSRPDEASMVLSSNVLGPCSCDSPILSSLHAQLQDSMCEISMNNSMICRVLATHFRSQHCTLTSPKTPRCGISDGERSLVLDLPYLLETFSFSRQGPLKSKFIDTLVNDLYANYYYAIPPITQTEPNEEALWSKVKILNKRSVATSRAPRKSFKLLQLVIVMGFIKFLVNSRLELN